MNEEIEEALLQGDFEMAQRSILALDEATVQCYYNCHLIWRRQGPQAALIAIQQGIKEYREDAKIWGLYALLQHEIGAHSAAIGGYQKALEIDDSDGKLWINYGLALFYDQQLEKAKKALLSGLHSDEHNLEALMGLAMVQRHLGEMREALFVLREAQSIHPDDPRLHLLMGHLYRDQFLYTEAILSYQRGLNIAPNNEALLQSLTAVVQTSPKLPKELRRYAVSEHAAKRKQVALRRYLEKTYADLLEMDEQDPCAVHLRSALHGDNPEQPPEGYVEELFDDYADRFENHLLEKLAYQVPQMLADVVLNRFTKEQPAREILDIGAGTGLLGPLVREQCQRLIGVDISSNMLKKAEGKNVYDQLHHADIVDFLHQSEQSFQVIVAADTLVYMGDLRPLFKAVSLRLSEDGFLMVTVEKKQGDGFRLQHTGRYKHSLPYIQSLLHDCGLWISRQGSAELRKGSGEWVEGLLMVICKGN